MLHVGALVLMIILFGVVKLWIVCVSDSDVYLFFVVKVAIYINQ